MTPMATKAKTSSIKGEDKILSNLNERQKLFCYLYTSDRDCFCNATRSYMAAYELTKEQYDTGRQNGYKLLTNAYIKKFINSILDKQFTDIEVDRTLAETIKQGKDLRSRVAAISEYNKLRARITEKHDITSNGEAISAITYAGPK